ncbi:MAG: DUF1146 family protein [Solobacterium sp.]|nr:DUF1146 family protein [Solobacterium sp.]
MDLTTFLVNAFVYVGCFAAAFWALGAVQYEKMLKPGHTAQAQVLYFMMAMALGYLCGSFLLAIVYR